MEDQRFPFHRVELSEATRLSLQAAVSGDVQPAEPATSDSANFTLRFTSPPGPGPTSAAGYANQTYGVQKTPKGDYLLEQISRPSAVEGAAVVGSNCGEPESSNVYKGAGHAASGVDCVLVYNESSQCYELHMVDLDIQAVPIAKPRRSQPRPMGTNSAAFLKKGPSTNLGPADAQQTPVSHSALRASPIFIQKSPKTTGDTGSQSTRDIPASKTSGEGQLEMPKATRSSKLTMKTQVSSGSSQTRNTSILPQQVPTVAKPSASKQQRQSSPLRLIRKSMERSKIKALRLDNATEIAHSLDSRAQRQSAPSESRIEMQSTETRRDKSDNVSKSSDLFSTAIPIALEPEEPRFPEACSNPLATSSNSRLWRDGQSNTLGDNCETTPPSTTSLSNSQTASQSVDSPNAVDGNSVRELFTSESSGQAQGSLDEDFDHLADDLALELDEFDDSTIDIVPPGETATSKTVVIGTAGILHRDDDSSSEEE